MLYKAPPFPLLLDLEFHFPFGWGELWGIADRGNYDLKCHSDASGKMLDMEVKALVPFILLPPSLPFVNLSFCRLFCVVVPLLSPAVLH